MIPSELLAVQATETQKIELSGDLFIDLLATMLTQESEEGTDLPQKLKEESEEIPEEVIQPLMVEVPFVKNQELNTDLKLTVGESNDISSQNLIFVDNPVEVKAAESEDFVENVEWHSKEVSHIPEQNTDTQEIIPAPKQNAEFTSQQDEWHVQEKVPIREIQERVVLPKQDTDYTVQQVEGQAKENVHVSETQETVTLPKRDIAFTVQQVEWPAKENIRIPETQETVALPKQDTAFAVHTFVPNDESEVVTPEKTTQAHLSEQVVEVKNMIQNNSEFVEQRPIPIERVESQIAPHDSNIIEEVETPNISEQDISVDITETPPVIETVNFQPPSQQTPIAEPAIKTVPQDNLLQEIETMVVSETNDGKITKTAKIQLTPEHLGSIEIEVVVVDKEVTANVVVETAETKHWLEQNINQLTANLSVKNIKVQDFNVSVVQPNNSYMNMTFDENPFFKEKEEQSRKKRTQDNHHEDQPMFDNVSYYHSGSLSMWV